MIEGRFLHVMFCDDIRQELRNKYSLVGCYGPDLLVQELPVVLPKLCMLVEAVTPVAHPFKRLTLRILLSEDLVEESEIEMNLTPPPGLDPAIHLQTTRFMVILAPFQIKEPGYLEVHVVTENEVLRAGGLALRLHRNPPPVATASAVKTPRKTTTVRKAAPRKKK